VPVITQKFVYRSDLQSNRSVMYLFGDNHARKGLGGQAKEMRGEPNAHGIRTKWAPTYNAVDFFSDSQFDKIVEMLDEDFHSVFEHLTMGNIVVLPEDGLGTGISRLPELAPKTFAYILDRIAVIKAL